MFEESPPLMPPVPVNKYEIKRGVLGCERFARCAGMSSFVILYPALQASTVHALHSALQAAQCTVHTKPPV